jgi:hypothetical protein
MTSSACRYNSGLACSVGYGMSDQGLLRHDFPGSPNDGLTSSDIASALHAD